MFQKLIPLLLLGLAGHSNGHVGSDEPLLLTPYIKSNRIAEAKARARVDPLPNTPSLESYSGYLTVNESTGSNIFFWYFPSKKPQAPVALWLQGGPGAASTYGLFNEIGPFQVNADLTVGLRKYAWSNLFSYLYIDQPVGSGFSYVEKDEGYVRSQEDVARDLYEALVQFFQLFSEWKGNDFYITGESYAGKYIPAIGYKLHQERSHSGINLKGVAIGDGLVDGPLMLQYSDLLYNIGMFNWKQAERGRAIEREIQRAAKEKRYLDCFYLQDHLLAGDRSPSFFTNVTGTRNYFNYLMDDQPVDTTYSDKFLALAEVRQAIHVGNRSSSSGDAVYDHLLEDFCQTVKPWLEVLMDQGYEVMLYSGSLDIVVGVTSTENLMRNLHWTGAKGFADADRQIWRLDGQPDVAGYITSYRNFHYVIVRNAGHMVPHDQPKVAYEMIQRFLNKKL